MNYLEMPRLTENIKITFATESKASLSFASLLLCVAHTPRCTDNSKFSRLQLFTTKYLKTPSFFKKYQIWQMKLSENVVKGKYR